MDGFCCVCKKPKKGYFEPLKPQFEKSYRPRDRVYMCCKECWNSVGSDVGDQSFATPSKRKKTTPPSTPSSPTNRKVDHPMCRICDNNEGWFHTFEVDSVGFSTCNFLRQLFGKPIWNEPIVSCKSCYLDTLGVRTSLDNLAKRIDGPPPLTRSESDFFANCVFQREGALDPIARLSFEEESVASPHSPPHSPKQKQKHMETQCGSEMKEASTNTYYVKPKGEVPAAVRVVFARLQSEGKVSANMVGFVYDLLTSIKPRREKVTRDTATRCLVELGEACTVQLAKDISPSRNPALGCDGSGTFFDRHALGVHISWEGGTELVDVIDLVDKSASGYLAAILKCLDRLQTLQRGMGLSPTPLWAFRTLSADNASVNTGSIGGLLVLFNEARHAAYRAEQPAKPFIAMEFKGCDDFERPFLAGSHKLGVSRPYVLIWIRYPRITQVKPWFNRVQPRTFIMASPRLNPYRGTATNC